MIGPGGAAGALSGGRGRFSGAVEVGGGGGGTYPNEPDGMTAVAQWEGDSLDPAIGLSDWGSWFQGTDIAVVADATSPGPTSSVLRFHYGVGDTSAGIRTADTFANGPYDELYFMYRIKYETGWELLGHKNFFWGARTESRNNAPGTPTQFYSTFEADKAAKVNLQNETQAQAMSEAAVWTVGDWIDMEIRVTGESSPGAGDGQLRYYHNGVLIGSNDTVQWTQAGDPSSQFDGCQWYTQRNDSNTVESWFRVGEFYISGRNL